MCVDDDDALTPALHPCCVVLSAAGKEKQAKLNAEKTTKTLAF
jgi:hypothetical protein